MKKSKHEIVKFFELERTTHFEFLPNSPIVKRQQFKSFNIRSDRSHE